MIADVPLTSPFPHCLICGVIANNILDRMGLSF
nr:MAG TPA: zinc finger domain protein [Caudoviricetes sp.]